MTDSQASLPSPPDTNKSPKNRTMLPLLVLVAVLVGLSVSVSIFFWQQISKQQALLEHAISSKNTLTTRINHIDQTGSARLTEIERQTNKLSEVLAALDKQALFNSKQLNQLHASSRSDWLLAEAEYLMRLANQRLNIEKDSVGSEAILSAADKVLAEIEDPSLLPIRIAIAEEIFALQSIEDIDKQGIYARLEALITALEDITETSYLNIKTEMAIAPELTSPETHSQWQALWNTVWSDLQKAFVIRRLDHTAEPLLAPEQSYYLKQNLRLMLEQASLALLDNQQEAYRKSLKKSARWIQHYFDTSDKQVTTLLQGIVELTEQTISRDLPDISASLRLLKNKIEAMYRTHELDKLSNQNQINAEQNETPKPLVQDKQETKP